MMWKDYLSFSRQEQKGFMVLMVMLLLLVVYRLVAPVIIPSQSMQVVKSDSLFLEVVADSPQPIQALPLVQVPDFDPNEVTLEFLLGIGLNERLAQTWISYIKKGGVFKTKQDVSRVYGMDSLLLESLLPHMSVTVSPNESYREDQTLLADVFLDLNRIGRTDLLKLGWSIPMTDTLTGWLATQWVTQKYSANRIRQWLPDSLQNLRGNMVPKRKETPSDLPVVLEINSADTAEWMLLDGIGPVISRRIVAYRKKLGGFVAVEQLLEVYGVSPVLVEELRSGLRVDTLKIVKLDINKVSLRQLRDHPCFGFYKAQAVVEERKKRGRFAAVQELYQLPIFQDAGWERSQHYLVVN